MTDTFKDYGVVMDELGAKWKDLSAAEQNYIAFQMAGTRNMNRFITLMNGYGEATRLTSQALNESGTAMEKYAVWMETVEAAQNNLQNSLESLYALLLDGSVVKGFYNGMAGLVDYFTRATEASNKLNIVLPGVAAGIALVSHAFKELAKAGGISGLLTAHPLGAIAVGFGALVTVLTVVAEASSKAKQRMDEFVSELETGNDSVTQMARTLAKFENVSDGTEAEVDALKGVIQQ